MIEIGIAMLELPPMPGWNAIHPLIIHFPLVLLLLAPFLVLVGALCSPERGRILLYAALVIMALGTTGTYLAVASGEVAAQLAERSPQIDSVLEHHEQLAETTRIAFSVLTVVFAAVLIIPWALKTTANRIASTILPLVFLFLYGGGIVLLANTAHQGARLVHEFGVTAAVETSPLPLGSQDAERSSKVQGEQKDVTVDRD